MTQKELVRSLSIEVLLLQLLVRIGERKRT